MKAVKRISGLALTLALLSVPFLVYFNAQALTDWWRLRGYTPPKPVSSLAAQDTMTPYARHVFYVNHPDLESSASQFRADCNESEQTIVLGCYRSDQNGIFIYDVQDKRLAGVQQVTAAHEMLHAAYDRLSASDKSSVDNMLADYYNTGLTDQRIKDTINEYKKTEPNDLVNEMHSIFGTEIARLPAPLEKYYQRYFTDRQAVIGFEQSYQGEFTSRESQIKADDAKLASMKADIESQEASLRAQAQAINADRARLDSQKAAGDTQAYNSGVPGFNREVEAYNAGVERLRREISAYNQLVVERNAIAVELTSLDQAIDTRLSTQSAQ
ncbi:MAG TPA: hypothetical protein VFJ84_02890 [Candidatus Saccharimonadales bacterium]|nr:hypothetical protein [Candidatus Saccharimonadales bacterium]